MHRSCPLPCSAWRPYEVCFVVGVCASKRANDHLSLRIWRIVRRACGGHPRVGIQVAHVMHPATTATHVTTPAHNAGWAAWRVHHANDAFVIPVCAVKRVVAAPGGISLGSRRTFHGEGGQRGGMTVVMPGERRSECARRGSRLALGSSSPHTATGSSSENSQVAPQSCSAMEGLCWSCGSMRRRHVAAVIVTVTELPALNDERANNAKQGPE